MVKSKKGGHAEVKRLNTKTPRIPEIALKLREGGVPKIAPPDDRMSHQTKGGLALARGMQRRRGQKFITEGA